MPVRPPLLVGASVESDTALVVFDATLSEQWQDSVRVLQHPAEDGFDIADHVEIEPRRLSMTAHFSDTPVYQEDVNPDLALLKFERLLTIMRSRELVTVTAELRIWDNMVITSLDRRAKIPAEGAIEVDIDFQEVRIVSPELVFIPADVDTAVAEADRGPQNTDAPTDEEAAEAARQLCEEMDVSAAGRMIDPELQGLCDEGVIQTGLNLVTNLLPAAEFITTPAGTGFEQGLSYIR